MSSVFYVFPLLEDKQRVKFGGVLSIFYTHFIPVLCLLFDHFYDINKFSNALNVHLYN